MKYDYQCNDCTKITEITLKLAEIDKEILCDCGGLCKRVILSPATVHLDPISGGHVGATERWVKGRERKMAKERHNMKEHGTYT